MIPILSGIIVGQGDQHHAGRGFSLAFIYVQGMALTYAAAGAIVRGWFQAQRRRRRSSSPGSSSLFALLFVALAFAMFGAYTCNCRARCRRASRTSAINRKRARYIGTFIMGALSALIVTACVAPAIVGALSRDRSDRQRRARRARAVRGRDRHGRAAADRRRFGRHVAAEGRSLDGHREVSCSACMFLGVAIYMLNPLLPDVLSMLLWSALAIISGFWIFSLQASRRHRRRPRPCAASGCWS